MTTGGAGDASPPTFATARVAARALAAVGRVMESLMNQNDKRYRRVSWKTVAENLCVFLSREEMVRAEAHWREFSTSRLESKHARDAALQTADYLADAIREYDRAFGA